MNISLEKSDAVTAKLTVKMEKADYENEVEKSLKKIRQKANMPGFRPGNVPMGLVKKMYGTEVKAEEVNKKLSESVNNYIKEQKLRLVVDPMMSEEQAKMDIEKDDNFEFAFDLGFAPEMAIELGEKDSIDYYEIAVDDKMLDASISTYQRQGGKHLDVEAYGDDSDLLRGALTELDENGAVKEGGIALDSVSLMPRFFADDAVKEQFKNEAKKGADVVFSPAVAYKDNDVEVSSLLKIKKEEVADHKGNFKFNVASISRFVPAELNQELFDTIYGKDAVKSEEEFRARVKGEIEASYVRDSDYKFLLDVRQTVFDKLGEVTFPNELLKRFLLQNLQKEEDKNNIDNVLVDYIKDLKWSLIRTQLAEKFDVKIDDAAIKETAKEMVQIQMAQYGINNIPEQTLEQYAGEMLKDERQADGIISRSIDRSLIAALKKAVKLNKKSVSIEDFNKMFEEK